MFVGRERELRAFDELLAVGDVPRTVFVYGPGGIGKSRLLDGFRKYCRAAAVGFAWLDGRLLTAAPAAIAQEVTRALSKLQPMPDIGALQVLALDHAEQLAGLDGGLRQPERGFDASRAPGLIQDLTQWLLRDLRRPSRLLALAACATVKVLNESLLAAMLGFEDARAEFETKA